MDSIDNLRLDTISPTTEHFNGGGLLAYINKLGASNNATGENKHIYIRDMTKDQAKLKKEELEKKKKQIDDKIRRIDEKFNPIPVAPSIPVALPVIPSTTIPSISTKPNSTDDELLKQIQTGTTLKSVSKKENDEKSCNPKKITEAQIEKLAPMDALKIKMCKRNIIVTSKDDENDNNDDDDFAGGGSKDKYYYKYQKYRHKYNQLKR